MSRVLTPRELNRSTLARQMLLQRHALAPMQALQRLAGLNAQLPSTAYLSLAARLERFAPPALVAPLRARQVARANLMRGTIHLLTVGDYYAWRPALQPVLDRVFRSFNAAAWRAVDPAAVRRDVRTVLAGSQPTRGELTERLGSALCRSLGDRLVRYEGADGRLLYDVPGAPLPDPQTVAPVRFVPEFDNLIFGHTDRSRIVPPAARKELQPGGGHFRAPLLIDGIVAGTWRWDRPGKMLSVTPFESVPSRYAAEVRAEARRLADFFAPSAGVRFAGSA